MPKNDRSHLPWIMNPSGGRWYPTDPRPEDFTIEDIATNLSNINRFNGAIPYSVAAHSVEVSRYLEDIYGRRDLAFQGLMHDAAEAVVGDLVSPLKAIIPEFSAIEDKVWAAICIRFNLSPLLDPLVIQADKEVGAVEAYHAFSRIAAPEEHWWDHFQVQEDKPNPMPSSVRATGSSTKICFLAYFKRLTTNA